MKGDAGRVNFVVVFGKECAQLFAAASAELFTPRSVTDTACHYFPRGRLLVTFARRAIVVILIT